MRRIKDFFIASLIGGFIIAFSVSFPFALLNMLLNTISLITGPLVKIASMGVALNEYVAKGLEFSIALALCFSIGVLAKTRLGRFVEKPVERIVIGYSLLRDALSQFSSIFKNKKTIFISSAIFFPEGRENTEKMGFVVGYPREGYCRCFEPTAPNFTTGFIHTLRNEVVFPLPMLTMQEVFSIVVACGAGGSNYPAADELESVAVLVKKGKRP
ncbi:MAG: DUF502 domain-containing protein [Parcubacteria group bacterium]|nr:DUF502 domain-containing protein [Parcubacteria group bacterium]